MFITNEVNSYGPNLDRPNAKDVRDFPIANFPETPNQWCVVPGPRVEPNVTTYVWHVHGVHFTSLLRHLLDSSPAHICPAGTSRR